MERKPKVLVACEESQAVTVEMRRVGVEAYSCDIIDCSGGHPEWHIKWDALALINGNCSFMTCDGELHHIDGPWDMLIAHPPCTYLTVTGNRWFNVARYGEKAIQRMKDREEAVGFLWHLQMRIATGLQSRTRSVLCQRRIEGRTKSFIRGCLHFWKKK